MTEPLPTLAGYGEVLVLQQDGYDLCSRWILFWRSMVYTTRCWVEELLQNQPTAKIPQFSQGTTATICSTGEYSWYSYWKTILTQPQTRNSHRIDRRASQQGSRAGVAVLVPDFSKFVNERNRRQLLKCKGTINLSTFNVGTLKSIKQMSYLIAIGVTYHIDVINVQEHILYRA